MEIKVVPFVPQVTDVNPSASAATELQSLINNIQSEGWEFVNLSSMQTAVKPTGCNKSQNNGQASIVNIQLLIFKKQMLAKIGKYIIEYYWRKVPESERRVCIHKISCSNLVYNTFNKHGFIEGIIVYIKRRKSCNGYYQIGIENNNVFITTNNGEIIKEDLINPIIVKEYKNSFNII